MHHQNCATLLVLEIGSGQVEVQPFLTAAAPAIPRPRIPLPPASRQLQQPRFVSSSAQGKGKPRDLQADWIVSRRSELDPSHRIVNFGALTTSTYGIQLEPNSTTRMVPQAATSEHLPPPPPCLRTPSSLLHQAAPLPWPSPAAFDATQSVLLTPLISYKT